MVQIPTTLIVAAFALAPALAAPIPFSGEDPLDARNRIVAKLAVKAGGRLLAKAGGAIAREAGRAYIGAKVENWVNRNKKRAYLDDALGLEARTTRNTGTVEGSAARTYVNAFDNDIFEARVVYPAVQVGPGFSALQAARKRATAVPRSLQDELEARFEGVMDLD